MTTTTRGADTVANAAATPDKEQPYAALGLKADEYAKIREILGRRPTTGELAMYSVMWSEHCSYKSSRVHLKTLPTTGKRVLQGPGENAGAVDIGDGLAAVFKIESHNHPSFIEPYQGAATGVGGIIRDIFTMGARPIALLNSLRFGSLDEPLVRRTRGSSSDPNRSELSSAIGRAPIVKMSRMMPPTPVAAPW